MELGGARALVTGATGGLGQAIVRELHGRGADVILSGRRAEVLSLGRSDGQVKIRGHRVEPGEVESLLRGSDGVAQAVVRPVQTARGTGLGAWIVPVAPETGEGTSGSDRDELTAALLRVIGEAALRRRLGDAGPAAAARYDLPTITARWEGELAALVSGRRGG